MAGGGGEDDTGKEKAFWYSKHEEVDTRCECRVKRATGINTARARVYVVKKRRHGTTRVGLQRKKFNTFFTPTAKPTPGLNPQPKTRFTSQAVLPCKLYHFRPEEKTSTGTACTLYSRMLDQTTPPHHLREDAGVDSVLLEVF